METLETAKTITEVAILCTEAIAGLISVTGVSAYTVYVWKQGRHVKSMQAAWKATADLLESLKRPGAPLQTYFPQYALECQKQLDIVISEADALELEWENERSWVQKHLLPQRRYVAKASSKLKAIAEIHRGIETSSSEAYVLRARDHPLPRDGEVLLPSRAAWPNAYATGAHMMRPAEHLAYRQAQQEFTLPSSATRFGAHASASHSSVNIESPTSSTTSLLHGFGPTLPGIPPAGQSFPYLAPQARIPGTRSDTMPVPVEYAHFNQLAGTAYGHTAPTPAVQYSPYGQAAYPPSVPYHSPGSTSGSRRQ